MMMVHHDDDKFEFEWRLYALLASKGHLQSENLIHTVFMQSGDDDGDDNNDDDDDHHHHHHLHDLAPGPRAFHRLSQVIKSSKK